MLVGSDSAVFETTWDAITRGDFKIADTDFLSDVTIVGDVSGDTALGECAIKLSDVIADGNFELSFTDKEEGVIAVTFTAHFDPSDLGSGDDTEPWVIYWPDE